MNSTSMESLSSNFSSLENINDTSYEEEEYINDLITFYGEGILLTAVSTFGLIGNVMSIIVLTRSINSRWSSSGPQSNATSQGSGTSFSNLLRGLATFDALFLVVAIMSFGLPKMSRFYVKHIFQHIMVLAYGLLHTFRVGSVYVTLAVTFERFHAIICPLRHFKRKKYMLPGCILFAILYNIPKYFELQIVHDPTPRVTSTAMRENKVYVHLYLFWSKFILIEFIPYATILIMNIFIIIKITKSARFRKKFQQRRGTDDENATAAIATEGEMIEMATTAVLPTVTETRSKASVESVDTDKFNEELELDQVGNNGHKKSSRQRSASIIETTSFRGRRFIQSLVHRPRRTFTKKQMEEHNLGIILIAMSSLFIFCQSFKIIPDMYEMIQCNRLGTLGQSCEMKGPVINAILRLSHLLVCVNSSANFLIYYARGEKFRLAWIQTFGACWCWCCSKAGGGSSTASNQHNQEEQRVNQGVLAVEEGALPPASNGHQSKRSTRHHRPSTHSLEAVVELHTNETGLV